MRNLFAFILLPALFPLAYLGYLAATTGRDTPEAGVAVGIILPLSYIALYGLGLPAHLALRHIGADRLLTYLLCGLMVAMIARFAYFDVLVANRYLWWAALRGFAPMPLTHLVGDELNWWGYGTLMGGLFWLVMRPDRQRGTTVRAALYEGLHRSAQ